VIDENEIIWQNALQIAKAQVPESEFVMWFRLSYAGIENGILHLQANNAFLRDQFIRKYSSFMKNIISSLLGMPIELSIDAVPSALAYRISDAPIVGQSPSFQASDPSAVEQSAPQHAAIARNHAPAESTEALSSADKESGTDHYTARQ
jgi:chromosomal replication initiation ATPase DnaA